MRPIRVTGVTGTSPPVPLDVYAEGQASVIVETGGAVTEIQGTLDNVFDLTLTPVWTALTTAGAGQNTPFLVPQGYRAVRATLMVPADVLVVSQQGIR